MYRWLYERNERDTERGKHETRTKRGETLTTDSPEQSFVTFRGRMLHYFDTPRLMRLQKREVCWGETMCFVWERVYTHVKYQQTIEFRLQ